MAPSIRSTGKIYARRPADRPDHRRAQIGGALSESRLRAASRPICAGAGKVRSAARRAAGAATRRFGIAGRVIKSPSWTRTTKIHIQPVRVGERSGSLWIIEEGLQPGQRVVVEGLQKVREGMTVNTDEFCGGSRLRKRPASRRPNRPHVQILHQPSDRRDGDFHHHGHRRPGHDGLACRSRNFPRSFLPRFSSRPITWAPTRRPSSNPWPRPSSSR